MAPLLLALLVAGCDDDGTALDSGSLDVRGPEGAPDLAVPDAAQLLDGTAAPDLPPVSVDTGPACTGTGLTPGLHDVALQHDGTERGYLVYVPQGYSNKTPVPLVLHFHGYGSNASQQMLWSQMNATADSAGFILAYPKGIQSSWNAGFCCGYAAQDKLDDVGFARAVVADLQQTLCIDPRRIYATGMSNGGMMSHRLACEASDLFAAIGPVAGGLVLDKPCAPSRPVPVIHLHGTLDTWVDYSAGQSTVVGWVARNGCTDAQPTQIYNKGVATCEAYTQCKGGVQVVFCTITGGGHCWPGQPFCPIGLSTTDISANAMIWALFEKHTLP